MATTPTIHYYDGDLPPGLTMGSTLAVDTETMGLNPHRDRLCVVQLSGGDGVCHVVQLRHPTAGDAPHLTGLLTNPDILKIFHYARFDLSVLNQTFAIDVGPFYCTKIASRLVRTYTDRHGLKDLCKDLLGVELSKEVQRSDWGADALTKEQLRYAANDVLHLHSLKNILDQMLVREGRFDLFHHCLGALTSIVQLDLLGFPSTFFDHN